jgi:hypothetical protein
LGLGGTNLSTAGILFRNSLVILLLT